MTTQAARTSPHRARCEGVSRLCRRRSRRGRLGDGTGAKRSSPTCRSSPRLTADLRYLAVEPTIYEAVGGADTLLALAQAWHRRCLADPILSHPFEGRIHPEHTRRLAEYWSEQLGGPATYTRSLGDYSHVVRLHSGNGPHEQMDGRAVAAFVASLDDVGIPSEPRLRFQLIAWFTWATAVLNHRWASPDDVPRGLPLPLWNWEGTEGW